MYADRGADIALVTATRGDAGRAGEPALCSRDDLPARREAELREAARILGIGHVTVLDYLDKHLAEAPPARFGASSSKRFAAIARRSSSRSIPTAPTCIPITSRSRGSRAMPLRRRAIHAGIPTPVTRTRVQRLLWMSPVMPWDAPKSPDLAREPGVDFLVDISTYRDVKAAALRAHRTQHVSIDRHFFHLPDVDRILSVETFRQAFGPPLSKRPIADLFESIVDRP